MRRFLTAFALVCGAMLLFSTGAFAAGRGGDHRAAPQHSQQAAGTSGSKCDVPGAACDPSKTDHDNGVGNNCDPGYGQGNQAKMGPDETTSSCRTKPSGSQQGEQPESNQPTTPPSCGTTTTASHSDHESDMGSKHESSTAEMHDSGTTTRSDSDTCGSVENEQGQQENNENNQESQENVVVLKNENETLILERLEFENLSKNVQVTITGVIGGVSQTFLVQIMGGNHVTVTVNGQPVSASVLEEIESLLKPGGGTVTVTLPNGTVLTFTGGVLNVTTPTTTTTGSGSGNVAGTTTTTVPAHGTTMVGGVAVANNGLVSSGTATTGGGVLNNAGTLGESLARTGTPLGLLLIGLVLLAAGGLMLARRAQGRPERPNL